MDKPDLAPAAERWTHAQAYIDALARRRAIRRSLRPLQIRTQPETPRLLLSTLPFAALIAVMGMLIVVFAIVAWPAPYPQPRSQPAQQELGTAAPGWFEEAKKDFR